jgi:hypothetical protein
VGSPSDGHEIIRWDSSTSGTPLNGSTETLSATNRPVSSLFISNSGDWRSTQNDGCGKQAAKLIPVPLVAFLLSRSGRRRLTLQIQAVVYTASWLWPVVGSPTVFANAGDLAVYWCYCKVVVRRRRPLLPSSADSENSDNRANGTFASKTSNYTFSSWPWGRNFI